MDSGSIPNAEGFGSGLRNIARMLSVSGYTSGDDQAESTQQWNNPPPAVEAVAEESAAYTGKKRRGPKSLLTAEERKTKKVASDRNYRLTQKQIKENYERLQNIAPEYRNIDQMESDLRRLKVLTSKHGGFEEIEPKLNKIEQMEKELAVFKKLKDKFGGTDNIESELDRIKNTSNPTEMALIDRLQSPADPPQDESIYGKHSMDSNNQGSTGCSAKVQEDPSVAIPISLAVETPDSDYSDVLVTDFIAKLEKENTKSDLDFSSFKDLDGERKKFGNYSFPMSLVSTAEKIRDKHADITRNCLLGYAGSQNIYIFFCAAIKEMGDLSLEKVTEEIMLKWRDAIMDASRIKLDVEFARKHLKSIAHAYFGLKAQNCQTSLELMMKTLRDDQNSLRRELEDKKREEKTLEEKLAGFKSSQCHLCLQYTDIFLNKYVGPFI